MISTSCQQQKILTPETPSKASWLMKMRMDYKDYQGFKSLFSEGRKQSVPIEEFNKMSKLTTAKTDFKNYQVLTFENGEMLLVRLSSVKIDGEYKIEDVIIVPENMKSLFNDRK